MSRLFGPIFQNGYVVHDLEDAIDHWSRRLGVGPFYLFPSIPFDEVRFRGRPSDIRLAVAMAFSGDTQIELIQPLNEAPSIYSEFLAAGRIGLQHVGVLCEDYDDRLARLTASGYEAIQAGRAAGGLGFAYFDVDAGYPGTMVELVQASRGLLKLFAGMKEAARGWDGADPIRRL